LCGASRRRRHAGTTRRARGCLLDLLAASSFLAGIFELTVEHVLERLRLLEAAADVGAQAEADDVRGALPGLALLGAHSKLDVPVLHAGSVPSTAVGSSKPPWRDPGPKDLQGRGLSRVAFGGALSERAPGRGSLVDAPP
jgi:hypothetical protein